MTTSHENGFATAALELLSGYPGYFYSLGIGDFIYAVDEKHGLPIRLGGDDSPDVDWVCGFNRGVIAHIDKYGVPWNSRLSSLDVLSDLPGFFAQRRPLCTRLDFTGNALKPDGFGFTLTLQQARMGVSLLLETDRLFDDPEIVPNAMGACRSGPPPTAAPTHPHPPLLKSGTKRVGLRFFDDARCVECVPAPFSSRLVVFRFSDFAPSSWRRPELKETFVALDTELGDWIPGGLSRPLEEKDLQ